MKVSRIITTVDSHTAGEGTRLVTGGLPPLGGRTMADQLAAAAAQWPWLPGFLLLEPRGHKDLFGALLVPPCAAAADWGLLFMDNQGYEPMCGHAVIGTVTTLIETGMQAAVEPETRLTLDTPAGLIEATARVDNGRVVDVSFENVPSFVYRRDVLLDVAGLGELRVDVAFGGLFFVVVDAGPLGLALVPAEAERLADLGMRILAAANAAVMVRHPELPHIDRIIDLRFILEPGSEGADSRNVVVLGQRMIDRSPCGTGTSAETAWRVARGKLAVGESFVTESIIGTRFTGQAVRAAQVGQGAESFAAVVPRISGKAYLTGFHQFVLDEEDPFPRGFQLGGAQ